MRRFRKEVVKHEPQPVRYDVPRERKDPWRYMLIAFLVVGFYVHLFAGPQVVLVALAVIGGIGVIGLAIVFYEHGQDRAVDAYASLTNSVANAFTALVRNVKEEQPAGESDILSLLPETEDDDSFME